MSVAGDKSRGSIPSGGAGAAHDYLRGLGPVVVSAAGESCMPESEYHLVVGVVAGLRKGAVVGF